MIVKEILKILKRTPINVKSDKESEEDEGDQSHEDSQEDEEDAEDLVRLICLFMCTSLFFTTKDANALTEKYISFVLDLEKAKNISWPDLIHSHLERELNENEETVEHTNGCAVYLLPWFAEHTHLVQPEPIVTEPEGMYVPRVARWNHTKICTEFLKDIDLSEYEVNIRY
ncbi:hypothetical protein MKW98_007779 [Papaver atlanticum]|uniref:Uncharacterized protein n=1 Tax=Papaver atlanticum TaxID=357466 RepID=A0AAD4RY51_9MAGN|nr:hypothetical protein MKW98_007779 [Papaver atlanticum]